MRTAVRKADKNRNKNIRLGYYFFIIAFFIILVSISFKVFDNIKKSTFDGDNFHTVAVFSESTAQIISVSPKENSLKKIVIEDIKSENKLRDLGIPFDSLANSEKNLNYSPKSYFTKMLFHQDSLKTELTLFDLIRLAIYSNKISSENVKEESISINDKDFDKTISSWFADPEIVKENYKIEIVNGTDVSGLGGKFADMITNAGGNVVLVHSTQEDIGKSIIYYSLDSYTVNKISKFLDIPKENKEINSVSDIIIQIGQDRRDY